MKNLHIFIASSIVEFEDERVELSYFFQKIKPIMEDKLNISLVSIKCEHIDNRIEIGGKQTVYNKEIEKSDLVIFLFGHSAGDYTIQELDIAAKAFAEKDYDRHICVFCRQNPYKSEDEGLKKLTRTLDDYRILYIPFSNMDTVKLYTTFKIIKLL